MIVIGMKDSQAREKIISLALRIIKNKLNKTSHCASCLLANHIRNIPEIGALAGKFNWRTGLYGGEPSPEIMILLTPSGRHYATGSPEISSKEWMNLFNKYLDYLDKGNLNAAASIMVKAFELRISSPITWPKGGWFYNFIHRVCENYGKTAYFTRTIKCGVRGLKEQDYEVVFNNCKNYLLDELEVIRPKIVITIGNINFQFFKDLIKERQAFVIDAYSSILKRKIGRSFAIEEGLVKIHSNGYRFNIQLKNNVSIWLIPLLHPEFFLSYFDSFDRVIKLLEAYEYLEFPLGEFFNAIKHILKEGPAAVYLYPLWLNLKELLGG